MIPRIAPFLVVICGILRSTDLYFRDPVIATIPVLLLITWEHIINMILVIPILCRKKSLFSSINIKDFVLMLLVGVGASALGILCFTQAFHYMNPALAVLLQKLQPLMTILLGMIILGEKLSGRFLLWAMVAIVASYFVSFGLTSPFTGDWHRIRIGVIYAVAAAFFWGGGTIWGKMLLRKFDQTFVMANRFLFGGVFTIIASLLYYGHIGCSIVFNPEQILIGQIFYMAVISGILATSFYYAGLKWVDASYSTILELVFPVSSVVIMWVSFNRPLSMVQMIAAAIMFIAIYRISVEQRIASSKKRE